MSNPFFDHPILNSPYDYPRRHWELDSAGQPTQRIIESAPSCGVHHADPEAQEAKSATGHSQDWSSTKEKGSRQRSSNTILPPSSTRCAGRSTTWRTLPRSSWQVTPETARLLQHWRHHNFAGVRPFFCQIEAVETAIWLTEVAPHSN